MMLKAFTISATAGAMMASGGLAALFGCTRPSPGEPGYAQMEKYQNYLQKVNIDDAKVDEAAGKQKQLVFY